jgi:hypothetical protein
MLYIFLKIKKSALLFGMKLIDKKQACFFSQIFWLETTKPTIQVNPASIGQPRLDRIGFDVATI